MKLADHAYSSYTIIILKKINFIKEVMKRNYDNYNLFLYLGRKINLNDIINFTGILNRPFYDMPISFNMVLYYCVMYLHNNTYKNNIQIIINYFGILNTPSLIITKHCTTINNISKTNIINKLILVYGRY
jgi:hypothetical protein